MSKPIKSRLEQLRAVMQRNGIAAYIVPSTDAHQSEYVPPCWQRRQWISGFTGSAGDVVVTLRAAALWTDGRYFLQAEQELAGSDIELCKIGQKDTLSIETWLRKQLSAGETVGIDPKLLSPTLRTRLQKELGEAEIGLTLVDLNLIDQIWTDQPAAPDSPIELYPVRYAGETSSAKLKRLRRELKQRQATAHVLTALDAIAWLFNIRGTDVPFNPVAICNAVIGADSATLFIDATKIPATVGKKLSSQIEIAPYDAFATALEELSTQRATVWVDEQATNSWVLERLANATLIRERSPIWQMKAKKNDTELAGMQQAHLRDGVAMVRFLAWLDHALAAEEQIDEVSVATKLERLRSEGSNYRGQSFAPIAGYGANGAVIHYSASPESASRLRRHGLFLIDSGGQYLDGTTDITRTVALGKPTAAQKQHFTRVLKGHIAIASCVFPEGTSGRQIDVLARQALWQAGLDYAHGTGHGVGCYLNVHEGPQSINPWRCTGVPLEAGNVLSNEPGYYLTGEYGIRIENLLAVRQSDVGPGFLCFEELTLCPIDIQLVVSGMLSAGELKWLNDYHARVRRELLPLLPAAEARWLRAATKRLQRR
ncbi:MAG: aminopeptidase P family protein [Deltaproteobacteria bacterium]|nr:aminopeptidase P family protein [Deltaproteobacteria bacterium]